MSTQMTCIYPLLLPNSNSKAIKLILLPLHFIHNTQPQQPAHRMVQLRCGNFKREIFKKHFVDTQVLKLTNLDPVNNVNYDHQGRYLASCSSDLSIKLWDINNDYLCFKTLNGHNHNISYVNFNPQGDLVFSCSRDKTIRLWEINTGYCKKTFTGHEGWVRRLSISQDGQTFVSASDDQSVIVWNISK